VVFARRATQNRTSLIAPKNRKTKRVMRASGNPINRNRGDDDPNQNENGTTIPTMTVRYGRAGFPRCFAKTAEAKARVHAASSPPNVHSSPNRPGPPLETGRAVIVPSRAHADRYAPYLSDSVAQVAAKSARGAESQ